MTFLELPRGPGITANMWPYYPVEKFAENLQGHSAGSVP